MIDIRRITSVLYTGVRQVAASRIPPWEGSSAAELLQSMYHVCDTHSNYSYGWKAGCRWFESTPSHLVIHTAIILQGRFELQNFNLMDHGCDAHSKLTQIYKDDNASCFLKGEKI